MRFQTGLARGATFLAVQTAILLKASAVEAAAAHVSSAVETTRHVSMAAPRASQLMLEEAEQVRDTLCYGPTRYKLDEVGASWLNRIVSGKHVHRLGRRILSVEGFAKFRYKNGFLHEGDPDDPLKVARHTNDMVSRDPLLAPVPMTPLLACCAKTHLQS